jgi:hypothetical protein
MYHMHRPLCPGGKLPGINSTDRCLGHTTPLNTLKKKGLSRDSGKTSCVRILYSVTNVNLFVHFAGREHHLYRPSVVGKTKNPPTGCSHKKTSRWAKANRTSNHNWRHSTTRYQWSGTYTCKQHRTRWRILRPSSH